VKSLCLVIGHLLVIVMIEDRAVQASKAKATEKQKAGAPSAPAHNLVGFPLVSIRNWHHTDAD
jgi:hypothetical protein